MKTSPSSTRKFLLAAPALAAAAPAAHAEIIYTNPADLTIGIGGTGAGFVYFDLGINGGGGSSSTSTFPGYVLAYIFEVIILHFRCSTQNTARSLTPAI